MRMIPRGTSAPPIPTGLAHASPKRSRRGALAAAFGAAVAATYSLSAIAEPAPSTSRPDVELIADCIEFERLQKAFLAACDDPDAPENDDEMDAILRPISERQHRLVDCICNAHPTSLDGHRARARALACLDPEAMGDFLWSDARDARLTTALLRDLLGGPLPPAMAGTAQKQAATKKAATRRDIDEWQMPVLSEQTREKYREIHRQLMAIAAETSNPAPIGAAA